MLPLHHGHHESGDDRIRTGDLSPDKRALCSAELRPRRDSAGGIRTHDLELMRLARTAAPLPRKAVWPAGVEPAISGAQSRRGGQLPYSQKTRRAPPAGLEPAASGLRARRHHPFRPRGREAPAAGLEPALSRVTVARLTDSTTPERKSGGSRTRTCERRRGRLRASNALPCQLGHASTSGRRGSRTPKAREPTRFRDGIPRRWQSFREWPRQASNLQPSA